MKRARTARKTSGTKAAKPAGGTVKEYLAAVPEAARPRIEELRAVIRAAVPKEAVEVISYKIPAFKADRVLVWYAAFAKHCSLFPTKAVIEQFKNELKGYSKSKGTVHFPLDKPLPRSLIRKMVKARVKQAG